MAKMDRLGALDAAFLALERNDTPFEVGALLVLERAPLSRADGSLDTDRLLVHIGAGIDRLPRYRQRLARVPVLKHPIWVDDEHFAIERQVVVTSPEPPGDERRLSELVGRVLSEDLPQDRPPWRLWIVDGLGDGSFAIIAKLHHSLIDGISGVRLLEQLFRPYPEAQPRERIPWSSEPPPSALARLTGELRYRARGLVALSRDRGAAGALASLLAKGLRPAADAGLNPRRIDRRRRFAACELDLAQVKAVKDALGVKVNDVVLAVAAGALRRLLEHRGVDPSSAEPLRAMVPVSTHPAGERSVSGSRVALLLADLCIGEAHPRRRTERIHAQTSALKDSERQAEAGEQLVRLCDVTSPRLLGGILRLALWRRSFNVVITNIPGPPMPLYLLGSRLRRFVPIVNLWPGNSIGIAVASYQNRLYWGFQAGAEQAPDLEVLVRAVPGAFAELRQAVAGPEPDAAVAPA